MSCKDQQFNANSFVGQLSFCNVCETTLRLKFVLLFLLVSCKPMNFNVHDMKIKDIL